MEAINNLNEIKKRFFEAIRKTKSTDELTNLKVLYLGRKRGIITQLISKLPTVPLKERKKIAPVVQNLKREIDLALKRESKKFVSVRTRKIDFSEPAIWPKVGTLHPTTLVLNEIKNIFHYLGFVWSDGPEIEQDLYNFQKLLIDKDHPARDSQDTYYITPDLLLRTHTSSMQIRFLEAHKPPVRVLFPGRVYRRDQIDSTHLPAFYQLEGLLVDKGAKMTDLLGVIDFFCKSFFGPKIKTRVYGHYFPYTEPSIEVEVLHKSGRWLEILGAGCVHPQVLRNAKVDSKQFKGWAFGMGLDRIVMIKYGINDIRALYSGDLRFLNQF